MAESQAWPLIATLTPRTLGSDMAAASEDTTTYPPLSSCRGEIMEILGQEQRCLLQLLLLL